MSLRAQIALVFSALAIVLLGSTCVLTLFGAAAGIEGEFRAHGAAYARFLSSSASHNLAQRRVEALRRDVDAVATYPDVAYCVVEREDGTAVLTRGAFPAEPDAVMRVAVPPEGARQPKTSIWPEVVEFRAELADARTAAKESPARGDESKPVGGAVRVGLSTSRLKRRLYNATISAVLHTAAVLAVVGGLALFSTYWLLSPMKSVSEATRRVAHGEFGMRVPVPSSPTELSQLANSFNKMAEDLQATTVSRGRLHREIADKNDFLSAVSHDLGELSRNALLCVDSIARRSGDGVPAEAQRRLARLRASAEESVGFLKALKEVADTYSSREAFTVVQLSHVVSLVADEYADDIRTKGIDFSSADEWPTIRCEEERIKEAIRGLVDNAVRYIGAGDDKRIELGWSESSTHYIFWVRDNGVGIAPEQREGVFHIFRRGKHVPYRDERKGVGLAMVKAIAESYDGEAWVESELGKGSTFYFSLAKASVKRAVEAADSVDLPTA